LSYLANIFGKVNELRLSSHGPSQPSQHMKKNESHAK